MEIWCPIGPPPPSVRRRWLKKRLSSAAVSTPSTVTEPTSAAASLCGTVARQVELPARRTPAGGKEALVGRIARQHRVP